MASKKRFAENGHPWSAFTFQISLYHHCRVSEAIPEVSHTPYLIMLKIVPALLTRNGFKSMCRYLSFSPIFNNHYSCPSYPNAPDLFSLPLN